MGLIDKTFQDHMKTMQAAFDALAPNIEKAGQILVESYRKGGKTLLFGNGGSSTDALHIEGELLGRFKKDRPGLPAIALGGGIAALSAVANDYSYETAFARFVEAQADSKDVLVLFSTSGNSKNIVAAAEAGRKKGASIISFTGRTGGHLKVHSDMLINIPSDDTPRIQEAHITICHILCEMVEDALF